MTDHPRTEAADLARIILDDSEADLPNDLYPLNVREARTLARAVIRMDELADRLEREADVLSDSRSGLAVHAGSVKERTVARIHAALNGETA